MKKKRKTLLWVVLIVIAILLFVPTPKSESTQPAAEPEAESTQPAAEPEPAEEATAEPEIDKKDLQKRLKDDYGFSVTTVNQDKTGKWRLGRYYNAKPIQEIAVDYYNAFFESDDQIHMVINFTLNTTTRIIKVANILDCTIRERVEHEERTAATLGKGMILAEYHVNLDTGEIEQLDLSDDELTDEQRELLEKIEAGEIEDLAEYLNEQREGSVEN